MLVDGVNFRKALGRNLGRQSELELAHRLDFFVGSTGNQQNSLQAAVPSNELSQRSAKSLEHRQ
jgi:hypothetical protein